LVPGAHKGEGLGNAFLAHIKETDGIFHVVRAFDDPEIVHTEVDVDPIRDMEIVYTELLLKDLEFC
jgi:obg-like ATPase 1